MNSFGLQWQRLYDSPRSPERYPIELSGLTYSGCLSMNSAYGSDEDSCCQWCHIPLTVLHNVGIVASHSTRDMVKPGKDNLMDFKDNVKLFYHILYCWLPWTWRDHSSHHRRTWPLVCGVMLIRQPKELVSRRLLDSVWSIRFMSWFWWERRAHLQ